MVQRFTSTLFVDNLTSRLGKYLGQTVQMIPHVSDEIVSQILRASQICIDGSGETPQICLIDMGGTVGDIESQLYLEVPNPYQSLPFQDEAAEIMG